MSYKNRTYSNVYYLETFVGQSIKSKIFDSTITLPMREN